MAYEGSVGRRRLMFGNLMATCVVLALLSTSMNSLMSPVMDELHVSTDVGQWLVSGYALALAAVMPLAGYLCSRFSSRYLYLLATGLYTTASLGCAFAPSFECLMVLRVVQACANGLVANLTQASILAIYPKGSQGGPLGLFGLSQGAAVLAGPVTCGLVADAWGWRSVFVCAAVLCFASCVLACFVMEKLLDVRVRSFDALSFLLSVVLFGGFTFGLSNVVSQGLLSYLVLAPLLCGVVAGFVFVRRQNASDQPFMEVALLRIPVFAGAVIASALLYAAMTASAALLPLYAQQAVATNVTQAGLVVLPGAIVLTVVPPIAGKAFDRWGMRPLLAAGALLLFVANAASFVSCGVWQGQPAALLALAALNCLRMLGVALLQMPLVAWGTSAVPQASLAQGTAILTALRNLAGAIGVAVFVGLLGVLGTQAGIQVAWLGLSFVSLCLVAVIPLVKR